MKTVTTQNKQHIINQILEKFDFNAVQEHMRKHGFHIGYNEEEEAIEVPALDQIKEVAEYVLKELLERDKDAVFIQDFIAIRNGDKIHLVYPTITGCSTI